MKTTLLLILAILPNIILSQTTSQDKLLTPEKINDTYRALKQGDLCFENLIECDNRLTECETAVNALNSIVQDYADDSLVNLDKINELQTSGDEKQLKIDNLNKEVFKLENKKIKWYNNKWIYIAVGFAGGVYVAK